MRSPLLKSPAFLSTQEGVWLALDGYDIAWLSADISLYYGLNVSESWG
jgi:hypothetical protein